jgi:7-cyano-7-deazaguanine synthase in queuosine biosynthesis
MPRAAAERFRICAARETVRVAGDFKYTLRLLADGFFAGFLKLPTDRCLDLLHIASGIYAIDRLARRSPSSDNETGIRTFDITFEVSDPAFWSSLSITASVRQILQFLTEEDWSLSFEPSRPRISENGPQHPLGLPYGYRPTRIALYSGGLDSAAGLANQLISMQHRYVLLTVGHQSWIRRKAADQLHGLQHALSLQPLIHSTLVTALRGGQSIRMSQQETTQRTRSLLFCACAIAVATAFEIEDIDVFENGVGSINLPIMTGMLFGGLATRSSHPTFLRDMSTLATAIAGSGIRFHLPFANQTKGEMLRPLRNAHLHEWLQASRSCVHTSWRVAGKSHCGSCPACIERRQAFAVADISEADHYSTDIFTRPPKVQADADYFRVYRDEARAWLAADGRPRRRMHAHLRGTDVPPENDERIHALQTRHSEEVQAVYGEVSP